MERIGEKLRRRREELGFTIDDIAETTRFRPGLIRAIEEGRLTVFPAEAYLKAFLRAYAETLGLEPEEVIRDQKSEEERVQEALKGIRMRPRPRSPRKVFVVIGSAAGAAVVAWLVVWPFLRDRDTSSGPISRVLPARVGVTDSLVVTSGERDTAAVPIEDLDDEAPRSDAVAGAEAEVAAIRTEELQTTPSTQAPAQPGEAESGPAVPETAGVEALEQNQPVSSQSCLEVSVSGWATKARLRAGDIILLEGWLRPGYRDTFCTAEAFVLDYVTDKDAISLVLNGEPVDLPHSPDKFMSDFEINPR